MAACDMHNQRHWDYALLLLLLWYLCVELKFERWIFWLVSGFLVRLE